MHSCVSQYFSEGICLIYHSEQLYICIIHQAWGHDGWILAKFFFELFIDQDKVEVNKSAKKNETNILPYCPNMLGQ